MAFNGLKYVKNVTKSFGYAIVDVAIDMNPIMQSFTETNADLGKELYAMVKDYKGTAKKVKANVVESDVYQFAKNYKKNLFEDLKTGKFYNKDRVDEISAKASGWDDESLSAEFSDMFSDDEDDISFDDWDKDILRSDMFMAEHIDSVGSKIANANAEVTIKSTEYMANVQKESTKMLYAQNNKLFGQALQGMAAINSNIGQLVGMPEILQVHANNASTFFEKTSGQLDNITELLNTLVKNTSSSEEEANRRDRSQETRFSDIFTSKGAPDIKKYGQHIKKNIMNNMGEFALLGDLFGNGVSMLQTLAANPMEELVKAGVKAMIPTVLKESTENFSNALQGFFGSAITKLNRSGDDNEVMNYIRKIFGIEPDLKTTIDSSAYEKGKVAWDGVSRKALVEVIPGQLAKIVSALTGEDPLVFNPEKGKMESIGRIRDRADDRFTNAANSAGYSIRKQMNKMMEQGKFRFKTKREQDQWDKDLDAFFENIFTNGGLISKDMDEMSIINMVGSADNARLIKYMLDRISKTRKGKASLLDLNRKVLSGTDQYTRQMNSYEAKGSVDNALYNGMFDAFIEKYKSSEEMMARNAIGAKALMDSKVTSSLATQIDDYGHNIFYYLQGIFQRQDAIYENSSYMVENWSGGGAGRRRGRHNPVTNIGSRAPLKSIEYSKGVTIAAKETEDRIDRDEEWYKTRLNEDKAKDKDIITSLSKEALEEFGLNIDTEEYLEKYKKDNDTEKMTLIDKMLKEKTVSGKLGTLLGGAKSFFRKPLEGIAKMFDSADDNLYDLIYGEDPSEQLRSKGFIGVVKDSIQDSFSKMNDWIDNHILTPLKEKFSPESRDEFGRKIFGVFGKDYDAFKDKIKDGFVGSYADSVKESAKGAFDWTKNAFKDVGGKIFGGGSSSSDDSVNEGALDRWTKGSVAHYATGGTVQKTGIAAVSKGELIIPSEMNPFYNGPTNKAQQIRDENEAVRNFFGSYAKGGSVDDPAEYDMAIDKVSNHMKNASVEISHDELKKYLIQVPISQKLMDRVDNNGNPVSKLKERINFLAGKAKAYITKKSLTHNRAALKGQQIRVTDYDENTGDYMTNDGFIGNAKNLKGRKIVKNDKTGEYEMREQATSFLGDTVLNLAQAAKAVHHGLTDNGKEKDTTAFDSVVDDATGNFKNYAGAMTVGGGIGAAVSALTGMVGGPLVGAAVGSAVGLTIKSDAVQNWLFGEAGEDGREGGVFSKETSKFITEKVPSIAKFSAVGGAAGTLLGHPMIGTFIGSAIGFADKSEAFGSFLFNGTDANGNRQRGILDMTKDEFNKKIQDKLPKIGAGAIGGLLLSPLPFGPVANLMLGSAIGFASDTETFKTKLFGAVGKDGERHGGIVGAFNQNIITPLGDFIKDQTAGLKDWLRDDIMKPLTDSVDPLTKMIGSFTKALTHPIKWLSGLITKSNSWLERTLNGQGIAGKAFKLGKSAVSNVSDATIGLVKAGVGLPFQLIGGLGARRRAKDIAHGRADYMTSQERLDWMEEHSEVNGVANDFKNAGDTIATGWKNLGTKGKRLSGIGGILSGTLKGVGSVGNIGTHFIRGAGKAASNIKDNYDDADRWMANATVEEKKQMRGLLLSASDAQKGAKTRIKEIQRELDANIRSNLFSLFSPKDRETIIKMAKKDGYSLDDIRKQFLKCKTLSGKKPTEKQADEFMETINEAVTELRRLQGLKSDDQLRSEQADALAKIKDYKGANGESYKWLGKAVEGGALHKKSAERLISMLDYDITMDDQFNAQDSEDDKTMEQAAIDREAREKQHNEIMDLVKVAVNALSVSAGIDQPYKDVKQFNKNDKVAPGSAQDINGDGTKTIPAAERVPLSDRAKNKLNPESLKEDTETPEQQQAVPAASFGGFIKKAGKAVLHAGEFVLKGAGGALGKLFGGDDDSEEESSESENSSSAVVQKANKKMQSAPAQAAPVAGMFDDDSTAAHVGNYLPGQVVWIADRRYKYDGQSQELIPDNSAAKIYEDRKRKAFANSGSSESETTAPDQQLIADTNDDTKTLSSLFESMGLGGGIFKALSGLKNLSWIPALAGPLAMISFFTGKLDAPISSLIKTIGEKLGFSDVTLDNMGASGEDGEGGYSDGANKRIFRNVATGVDAKGVSRIFAKISGGFGNAAKKLSSKKGAKRKVGSLLSIAGGKVFGKAGNAIGAVEDLYTRGSNALNKKIVDAAADGKFGSKIKSFAEGFDTSIWSNVDDVAEDAVTKKGIFSDGIKGVWSNIRSNSALKKEQKAMAKAAAEVATDAATSSKGIVKKIKDKLVSWIAKLVEKGKIASDFLKHTDEIADGIINAAEAAGKNSAKQGSKKTLKGALKSMGPVGWATTLAFAVADFVSGYQDANTILGISDATDAEKTVAGLVNSVKGVIEGIIAALENPVATAVSIGLSMVPTKEIVTLFCNTVGKVLGTNLNKKREAMNKKLKAYNEKTGKNYDTEQYLKTVNNDKTVFEKAGERFKTGLHNLGVSITGKGDKVSYSENRDSGYNSKGEFVEGYLNKGTKRWKSYYAKAINSGAITEDYAEALYLNECLADGQLNLNDQRRSDYESRIAAFKAANPDKTIPTITENLYGIINKGQVYTATGDGSYKRTHLFKKDTTVNYGNGVSSGDFVGSFATGGMINKTGYAALSKGELRTTPSKFSKMLGLSSIFEAIGGSGSDEKEYNDITDLGSFINDIQSLDPSTSEWKDYWAKADSSVKGKGLLGTLKKTLYRIAATMFMPSFAMGKMLESVNSSLDKSLNTGSKSSSDSSSAATGTSNGTTGTTATSSNSKSGGNIFTKAVGAAAGFVKNLFGFGKGSGLYGGASAVGDYFISQDSSKEMYGDSSYAEEGCAPATAAMFINTVNGNNMTMEEAGKYAVSRGYKVKGDGTKEGFFKDIFNSKGIASENVSSSNKVLENLRAGKPTVILGQDSKNKSKRKSPFGKNPHYVLATGLDSKGNIIVNDPEAKRGGKLYKPSILGNMKSAISTKTAGGRSGLIFRRHHPGLKFGGGSFDNMHIGNNGLNLIKSCEGCKLQAYHNDGETYNTIGYGHYGADVKAGMTITQEQATQMLQKDLINYENYVKQYVTSFTPTQNQFDALVSYCYNRGPGGLRQLMQHSSTPEECSKNLVIYWGTATKYKPGLVARRKKEQALFNSNDPNFVPESGAVDTSGTTDAADTSSESTGVANVFDQAFNSAMESVYGSTLLGALSSAGLYSGGDQTNAEAGTAANTGSTATTSTADGAQISSSATIGQDVANDAANYVGKRYVWGGTDLDNGIDCSGFVMKLYEKHGYNGIIHQSRSQFADAKHGTTIKGGTYQDLKPGDAMYFSKNGQESGIHHVGIYTGNGHMIHAKGAKYGVVDEDLSKSSYYQNQYIGAKRFGTGSGIISDFGTGDILSMSEQGRGSLNNAAENIGGIVSGNTGRIPTVSNFGQLLSNASDTQLRKSSGRITDTANVSQIMSDVFETSDNNTANTNHKGAVSSSRVGSLFDKISSGSDEALNNLVESVGKIVNLLQALAENTEPIAQICKLITGISNIANEKKQKEDEASKSTRKSMNASSSSAKEGNQSLNSESILTLLTAFAQM